MDGLSFSKELIGLATTIGVVPTAAIIGVCLYFFMRDIKKEFASQKNELQKISARIDSITAKSDSRDDAIIKQLNFIDKDKVSEEKHYRDLEGWKTELSEIRSLLIQSVRE